MIDGKGPREFGRGRGLGGTFNSQWSAGFRVAIPPGPHTVTVSFFEALVHTIMSSNDVEVSFNAEPGHTYEIDSVVVAASKWVPIIVDVTDKNNYHIVAPEPRRQPQTDAKPAQ
jgi:hypothetical protein